MLSSLKPQKSLEQTGLAEVEAVLIGPSCLFDEVAGLARSHPGTLVGTAQFPLEFLDGNGLAFEAQPDYLGGINLKEVQMVQSKQVRVFVMGFIAAALLFTVMAATTSNGPGPGRYRIETLESPTAMVVVLDTHTGELRYTGVGGAGGGKKVDAIEMFAEPVE